MRGIKKILGTTAIIAVVIFISFNVCADYARGMEYFYKAYAAYQEQNLNGALGLIQHAIAEDPNNAQHFALEGDIYYNLQDLSRAKNSWNTALRLNPQLDVVREKMGRLKVEKDVEDKLDALSESIFEIRINKDKEGLIGIEKGPIIAHLKSAYETIGADFNYYPKHKIIVLIYSARDFHKIRHVPSAVAGLYDGKIRVPAPSAHRNDPLEIKRILWHEYTHALIFDLAKGRCPLFLNEGLAEYEGAKAGEEKDKEGLRRIDRGENKDVYPLISYFLPKTSFLPKTLNEDKEGLIRKDKDSWTLEAGRFYSSSESLVSYILFIWGWAGMGRLLSSIGTGKAWPEAIKETLKIDPLQLEKRWIDWAT